MKFYIRNKWVSLRGSSVIKDENENDVFKVKGRIVSFSNRKDLLTMDDVLLYSIKTRIINIWGHKAFILDKDGNKIITVYRKVISLHDRYLIDAPFGKMEITGNILGFDYHISLEGKEIGHVSRKISLRDSFVLDTYTDFDYKLLIALVIAIDNISDNREQSGPRIGIFGSGE